MNESCHTYELVMLQHTATHCNTLQHTATHCNTLRLTAAHCNTLQHTTAHYSTLQHTTAHHITLHHTTPHHTTPHHTTSHYTTSPVSASASAALYQYSEKRIRNVSYSSQVQAHAVSLPAPPAQAICVAKGSSDKHCKISRMSAIG